MARKQYENPQLDMTPMIDVVFELIIFFVVTIKQEDIFSKLNANRPQPNQNPATVEENDTQVQIQIGEGMNNFVFNGRGMNERELDRNIRQIAVTSKKSTVLLQCDLRSPHGSLVKVLDICSKYGMFNLSIFSM